MPCRGLAADKVFCNQPPTQIMYKNQKQSAELWFVVHM